MHTVSQLLQAKASGATAAEVVSIGPDAAVLDALRLLADRGIGAVLVIEAGALVGILSERDYARKVVLQGRTSSDTQVRDIMSADVVRVTPADSVDHCMQIMSDRRIRHLPVLDDGAIVGVVSIGDLVKAVIAAQQQELEHLQRYIAS